MKLSTLIEKPQDFDQNLNIEEINISDNCEDSIEKIELVFTEDGNIVSNFHYYIFIKKQL